MHLFSMTLGACHTNCYLLWEGEECVIIDAPDEPGEIIAAIRQRGLRPRYLLLTHAHTDHILAAAALWERYGMPVALSTRDAWRLGDEALINSRPYVTEPYRPVQADIGLQGGCMLRCGGLELRFFAMPGHTEGSLAIFCGNLLFTGDTLLQGGHGRTDLPGGNEEELVQSLQRLAAVPGNYRVLPGHGAETTLEAERHLNPYLR